MPWLLHGGGGLLGEHRVQGGRHPVLLDFGRALQDLASERNTAALSGLALEPSPHDLPLARNSRQHGSFSLGPIGVLA